MAKGQVKPQEAESTGIQTHVVTASEEWEEVESPSYRERSFSEGNRVCLQKTELQACFQIETPEPEYPMLLLCMLKPSQPRCAQGGKTGWHSMNLGQHRYHFISKQAI